MTVTGTLKSKKGAVLMWAIVFGLVISALIALLLTLMYSSGFSLKAIERQQSNQVTYDQIGEYFVRCVEAGGEFPKGYVGTNKSSAESDFSAYSWMDETCRDYFTEVSKDYNFVVSVLTTDQGNFWNFYATKGYAKRLQVFSKTDDTTPLMTVVIEEEVLYDTKTLLFEVPRSTSASDPISKYKIVEWTTSDQTNQIGSSDLNILQKLWKTIGNVFLSVDEKTKTESNIAFTVFLNTNKSTLNDPSKSFYISSTSITIYKDELSSGSISVALPVPVCKGYVFDGWYSNSSLTGQPVGDTYLASSSATSSVNLYAKWTPNRITLDSNGVTDTSGNTVWGADATITLPTLTSDDYFFVGWYDAPEGGNPITTNNGSYLATSSVTLYAHWLEKSNYYSAHYSDGEITYFTDDNFDGYITIKALAAEQLNELATMGLKFDGWAVEGHDLVLQPGSICEIAAYCNESKALHLSIKTSAYSATLDATGGTLPSGTSNIINGYLEQLPIPTKAGCAFAGWYTTPDCSGTPVATTGYTVTSATNGTTLYAKWDSIQLSFDTNGGSAVAPISVNTNNEVTLPSATRTNYSLVGWLIDGTQYSVGAKVKITTAKTATAVWSSKSYTVSFDCNTSGVVGASQTSINAIVVDVTGGKTVPSLSATSHSFAGWYLNGQKLDAYQAGKVLPAYAEGSTSDIKLVANWTPNTYTVTFSGSNCTVTATANGSSISSGTKLAYGTVVTFTKSKINKYKDPTWNSPYASQANPFSITVTSDITVGASAESESCVTADTLVTLADGTQKPICEVQSGDMLLAWDFYTGKNVAAPVVFNQGETEDIYEVIHVKFSDGTTVGVVGEHGFFDLDLGKYVYFDANAAQYLGDTFMKQNGDGWTSVTLVDVTVKEEKTIPFDTNTYGHLCFYTNDMLSIAGGIDGLFNIFEVDTDTLTYNAQQMQADIETYGLLTLDDYDGMITEDMFNAFNGRYLGIAVGKGTLTWDRIAYLANYYAPLCR